MKKLILTLSTTLTELVTSAILDKLYDIAQNDLTLDSDVQGRVETTVAYEDAVLYLTTRFPNLYIAALNYYLRFVDDNVKNALLNANYGDGTGITTALANTIVFGLLFKNNTDIEYFNEFENFAALATASSNKYSFQGCTNLKQIKLPAQAITIWASAFRDCTSLQSVVLPGNVETLQDSCFRDCSSLTSITLPNSVLTLVGSCFDNSGLTEVNFGTGLLTIGANTFQRCPIEEIVIPDSVTTIGNNAFKYCTALTKITFGSGISSLGSEAFRYDTALNTVVVRDLDAWTNMTVAGELATPLLHVSHLTYNNQYVTSYLFPSGRTKVGEYCFYRNADLTSVTIPSGYTQIGRGAFYNCSSLRNITFEDSSLITTIGERAFRDVQLSHGLSFPNVTSVGDYAFEQALNWAYNSQTEITGFNNLTSVGAGSFLHNQNIKTVNITNCTNLDKKGCFAYTIIDKFGGPSSTSGELNLQNATGAIGEQCFRSNTGITKIKSLGSCTYIKNYAFGGCSNLTEADLPSTITRIGVAAFTNNGNGTNGYAYITVKLRATTPPTLDSVSQNHLLSIGIGATVYVPQGSLSTYQADSSWAALIAKGVTLIEGIPT